MNLLMLLQEQLQEGGMPFVEFMQIALYHPSFGYYTSGLQKLGKQGDFVTAPELTPLFGQTLANQCQEILSTLHEPVLLEFGAGSGQLCIDLLKRLEYLQCLPTTYYILEVSGNLRQRQLANIQQAIPHLFNRVRWLTHWPETPITGVIIANEVLDAMPVHRFLKTDKQLYESIISLNTQQTIIESFEPCIDPRLIDYCDSQLPVLNTPYYSEVNLFMEPWITQCSKILKQGAIFLIDYGFPRHEYYHPDRRQGTLMCHHQHIAHSNPLVHIGEQDITAHVDFTHVAESGYNAGLHVAGYTNQAAFLLSNGLLNLLDDIDEKTGLINAQQAIKCLTHPSEMGELFKVIALTKNLDMDLTGFQQHDKRVSL